MSLKVPTTCEMDEPEPVASTPKAHMSNESVKIETVKSDGDTEIDINETKAVKSTDEKPPKPGKDKKVKPELQKKILAYFGQELQSDRKTMTKQEVAEGCGFAKAGAHSFFYSWQDMEKNKHWLAKSGKEFYLTELGKTNIPEGIVLISKKQDNPSKQESFLKILLKQCKEAKPDKSKIIFDILSDGDWHGLNEFTGATGYANLKSKGLGYAFTHMEKKMKILEKNESKEYRFTDKCFPEGRP